MEGDFTKRRWGAWRRYKAGGITLREVGVELGVTPERIRQHVIKCDRKVRQALNREWNTVSDEIRDATLGVEFVFRNEVAIDDTRGWDQLEPTEDGSAYWPPTPAWRTEWGAQDMRPAKPRKVYTYYKVIIPEGADNGG